MRIQDYTNKYNLLGSNVNFSFGSYTKKFLNLARKYGLNYPSEKSQNKREIDIILQTKLWKKTIYVCAAYRSANGNASTVDYQKVFEDIQKVKFLSTTANYMIKRIQPFSKKEFNSLKNSLISKGELKFSSKNPDYSYNLGTIFQYKKDIIIAKCFRPKDKFEYEEALNVFSSITKPSKIFYITENGVSKDAANYLKQNNIRHFTKQEWKKHN